MNIKYVSNKSKFIDTDAERPRLMNMETAAELLAECGILEPNQVLAAAMANPIVLEKAPNRPPAYTHITKFNVEYKDSLWTIQGVKCTLQSAIDLLGKRGLTLQDCLRTLALAVDLEEKKR